MTLVSSLDQFPSESPERGRPGSGSQVATGASSHLGFEPSRSLLERGSPDPGVDSSIALIPGRE